MARTLGGVKHKIATNEIESYRTLKALDFLDLADHKMFDWNKISRIFDKAFQSVWIPTSGKAFPVDDCRVLHNWFNSERHPKYYHHSMKVRDPDWIGRNVFLEYVTYSIIIWGERFLDSGKKVVEFLNLADLCGFDKWKESGTDTDCCSSHYVFSRIYPSVLRGLYNIREGHPELVKKLWDMFCFNRKSWFMFFERIPDAQHLQLVLDVAKKYRLDIRGIEINTNEFSYLNVISEYFIQNRYYLIRKLLNNGLLLKCEPIDLLRSIYMGLWKSQCNFTASLLSQYMLESLFKAHLFRCLPIKLVKDGLQYSFQSNSGRRDLDADRGNAMLDKLVEAYKIFHHSFLTGIGSG